MASVFKRKGTSKWTAAWWDFDERGWKRREHCTGTTEKRLAERIAQKWEDKALAYSQGLGDLRAESIAEQEARPLEDHLRDFLAYLSSKGTGDKQVASVEGRVRRIKDHGKATRIVDLTPSLVLGALQHFRIPTEERPGLSLQSATHYIRAIKSFSRWLVRDKRTGTDALAHLQGFNAATDRRRVRRDLAPGELARMIQAAERAPTVAVPKAERDAEKKRRMVTTRMNYPDRAWSYRIAAGTGFRAAEVSSLTPESFDLDADTPTVAVEAAYSKHKRRDVQPIREDLAFLLRPWLRSKPRGEPVCPLPEGKAALLIRADLEAARAAWVAEAGTPAERQAREKSDFLRHTDGAGRVVDFHGLRVHYISQVVNAGASVKQAMELARHSDPKLTMKTYAKVRLHDLGSVLEGMQGAESKPAEERAKATGTYGAAAAQCPRPGPQSADESGPLAAIGCDEPGRAGSEQGTHNPLQLAGLGESGPADATQSETRPGRFELPTCGLGNRRSIQLSYERTLNSRVPPAPRPCFGARAPLPLVPPDQLALAQDVPLHRGVEFLAGGAGLELQLRVQRVDAEPVAVDAPALACRGPAVADLPEHVRALRRRDGLDQHLVLLAPRQPLGQLGHARGDAVDHPVDEPAGVGVEHHHGELLGPLGHLPPLQVRGHVLALALFAVHSVALGHLRVVNDRAAFQRHRQPAVLFFRRALGPLARLPRLLAGDHLLLRLLPGHLPRRLGLLLRRLLRLGPRPRCTHQPHRHHDAQEVLAHPHTLPPAA